MSDQEGGKRIPSDDQAAVELRSAVRAGDVEAIQDCCGIPRPRQPGLSARTAAPGHRCILSLTGPATFPSGPEIVQLLINAGADPNVKTSGRDSPGPGDETPLHYAASNDDVDVAEAENVSQAFWHACTAGQRRAAEYLLSRGPDLNWEPDYAHGTPLDAASVLSTKEENVISWLREMGARSASSD
jgi:ankyrin repeat protein